ncbi:hypothetical protein [uncultured Vibrio sp.]|uniref:hypothetical protein n=1 Tax=uncultured Vibrio sp. TaxID=114054 RepID=UPI002639230A|nr:hypothetical protein [uncultured Vibrio sp.]
MRNIVVYNTETAEHRVFDVSDSDAENYQEIRSLLVKALDLEIIYDQIIEAYWDFKNKVNYWNLRSISTPFADYVLNHEIRSSLNSLAFNLFNLSKLYLDWHFNERKKRCFAFEITNDEAARVAVESQRQDIYDSNIHYVVGCDLRGHSQHSALPVRTFTTGVRYDHETSSRTAHFSIFYDYDDLVKAGVPKKKLSHDIKLELSEIIDGFVYAISQKHMLNRELSDSIVRDGRERYLTKWQSLVNDTNFERYRCELHLESGEKHVLSLEWFEVYGHLQLKHRRSIDYSAIRFEK